MATLAQSLCPSTEYPHVVVVTVPVGRLTKATGDGPVRNAFKEAHDWCIDPDRPGRYTCAPELAENAISTRYSFSDPDVAFEFKMRFG